MAISRIKRYFQLLLTSLTINFFIIPVISQAQQAYAPMINDKGDSIGTVTFTQTDSGVIVDVDLHDLPAGNHAIHIHEKADCSSPDFKSAGGHFNPAGKKHGFLNLQGPHAGDLPNITVNNQGVVQTQFRTGLISLRKNEKNSLLGDRGKSVIIHQKPDDYITDPAGASGERIACGIIRVK